jgi:hypothetical protein
MCLQQDDAAPLAAQFFHSGLLAFFFSKPHGHVVYFFWVHSAA